MAIKNIGQQGIVFAVFTALFAIFALALPGFLTASNMLTLLQNVAVLGILGLAMAIVVIGRGIDISLIAALAVPPGLVLQMVQNGHSLPFSLATAFALTAVFGLAMSAIAAQATNTIVQIAALPLNVPTYTLTDTGSFSSASSEEIARGINFPAQIVGFEQDLNQVVRPFPLKKSEPLL